MGGSSPQTVTQKSTVELSPEQQEIYQLALPSAKAYGAKEIQQYQGSGVAGFTPEEIQAQQMYKNVASPAGGQLASQSAAAQSTLLDPSMLDVANNPYVQAMNNSTTRQVTDNLMENILPGLRSTATGNAGMYSGASTRDALREGRAITGAGKTIGDTIAQTMMNAYNTGVGAMGSAVGRTGEVQQQQLFEPNVLGAVGMQQRQMEQAKLQEDIAKFYEGQQMDLRKAQDLIGLVQAMPGATNVGTSTGMTPAPNPFMQGIGLLTSLLGLF